MKSAIILLLGAATVAHAQSVCHDVFAASSSGISFGNVVAGHSYSYEASGCPNRSDNNFVDPDGNQYTNDCNHFVQIESAPSDTICPGLTLFALVGKIDGGHCFQLGKSGSFIASTSGTLVLYLNDNIFNDNYGSFQVCLTPDEAPTACSNIPDLIAQVEALDLTRIQKRILIRRLSLNGFVRQVRAWKHAGVLPETNANTLIDCATTLSPEVAPPR